MLVWHVRLGVRWSAACDDVRTGLQDSRCAAYMVHDHSVDNSEMLPGASGDDGWWTRPGRREVCTSEQLRSCQHSRPAISAKGVVNSVGQGTVVQNRQESDGYTSEAASL